MIGSIANADIYLSGNASWSALDAAGKTAKLEEMSLLINSGLFKWKGQRTLSNQTDAWPRANVVVDGIVLSSTDTPANIENAVYEFIKESFISDLFASVSNQAGGVSRSKLGPLEIEEKTVSDFDIIKNNKTQFQKINMLLRNYLSFGDGILYRS